MQGTTSAIALICCLLAVLLRPPRSFAIYVCLLLWYPKYLVLQLGPLDIGAARIVVFSLLLNCWADSELRTSFKWCSLDTWVTATVAVSVVIPLITYNTPLMLNIESKGGYLMDSYCAYLVARFYIGNRAAMIDAVKWIAVALSLLAVLGIVEACSGWQPFIPLRQYRPWEIGGHGTTEARFGFTRAVGPFSHPILFGAMFSIFAPFVYVLRHSPGKSRWRAYLLFGLVIAGSLSSMSGGPWTMVMLTIVCLVLEYRKQWVKPILIFLILSIIVVGIISNRTIYHVVASYANPLGGGGWHRAKLIDCAIEDFHKWWLVGFRGEDPGWGRSTGMVWTDITNMYLVMAWRAGIWGLIAFCGMLICALRLLRTSYKAASEPALRSLYWAQGSIIVVLAVSLNGFHLFGAARPLLYCILGMIASSLQWHKNCLATSTTYLYRTKATV